ncbi:MAG TPA: hypothetical protein VHU82_06620 [Vicinamibacterales bacterium]|nr:hypothetical protein [Vicinamibacterales bacterium]
MTAATVYALALAMVAPGCSLPPGTPSATASTSSPTSPTTETFSGTLVVRGSSLGTFSVVQAGAVTVTINDLGAPANTAVGLGVGTLVAGTCSFSVSNLSAVAGSAAQITTTEMPGQYCVEIYDVGALTTAATFAISIDHS